MPEILVEFVPDFSKLENGVDELVSKGTISKEMGALFNDASKSIDQFSNKFSAGLSKIPKDMADAVQKGLKPAVDQAKKNITDLSTSGIKNLGELKKRVEGITNSFTKGFSEGVEKSLKDAGFSMEEFNKAIKLAQDSSEGLKTELLEITKQLQVLKLNGQENSQQYSELAEKAVLYRKAISDVSDQINKQASDTQKLDTAIEFVTGLASAFAILQGVQALAGKDNEELQKTLVKVQAAMSILIGLQQLQNILKKESNLIQAIENTQKKIGVISTNLETAAQSRNIIVKNAAVVAQKALNAVMSANPAFLLIAAFTALAGALVLFSGDTKDAKDEVEDFNNELERTNTIIDRSIEKIKEEGKLRLAEMKARGVTQDLIAKEEGRIIAEQSDIIAENLNKRNAQLSKTLLEMNEAQRTTIRRLGITQEEFNRITTEGVNNVDDALALLNKVKAVKTSDAWSGFNKAAKANNELVENMLTNLLELTRSQEGLGTEQLTAGFAEAERQREEAERKRKEAADKAEKDRKDREQKEKEARQAAFDDFVAKQKLRLLEVEKGSKEELQIKKDVLRAELQSALNNDKLTSNQRKLLIQQFFADQRELTNQFNAENKKKVLEDQASVIQAQLAALDLSNEERTRLTIEQLQIERDLQLSAIINNETKRKEIIAKFDKEIFEARKKAQQDAFNQELEDTRRNQLQRKNLLEDDLNNEDLDIERRKAALEELTRIENEEFTKRRLNNQAQLKLAGLNNEEALKEFTRNAKDIDNDQAAARKKNEEKYTEIVLTESEKRLIVLQDTVGKIADTANTIIQAFRSFSDTMNANEDQRIEAQRDSLQRLRDLNAITEKEYIAKAKVIDRLERQTMQKQAEREKALALFEAFVNGAAAIVDSISKGPAAIIATSILVAAQIAAIASRPIPKFGKGTKSAPKGFAEVGETGTELIQMGDKYFVAEHPQVIWMKGGERVYNPDETKDILTPQANMTVINNTNGVSHENKVDYEKMAKKIGEEIAKHPRSVISLDEDGFSVHISNKLNTQKYLNKRFTFHD